MTLQHTFKKLSAGVLLAAALALAVAGVATGVAAAHERVEIGPYVVVLGWESEPVIVGERNALVLEITEDDAPVEGVESTLDVEVIYAGDIFRGNLAPAGEPGFYSVEMLPTVRGQYTVRLVGAIGDTEVDELLEPEEVLPAAALEFPQTRPDPAALQSELDDVSARLAKANLLAMIGVALGVVGVGVGGYALLKSRSG